MTKILVVGGDMDVIRILQDNLHGHEIVALTEREARNHIVLVDEHACPIGQYLAALNKPLSLTEINSILIHECLEMEAYERQSFKNLLKPNPAARYYHKFTQPYGKDHRNGRRC